jgi:hypothetical protein
LSKAFTTLGKSVLVAAGAGFGLMRSLRALNSAADPADLSVVNARIDALSLALAHLRDQSDQLSARQEDSVTRTEVAETLDRVFQKLTSDVDDRFERQTRSAEALHFMVGQTDELLQKVLDGLEAMRNDAIRNDAIKNERGLTQTRR